jgi:hypothetical protein
MTWRASTCAAPARICIEQTDPISPPGGYVGGGMQLLTDIAIDPAAICG